MNSAVEGVFEVNCAGCGMKYWVSNTEENFCFRCGNINKGDPNKILVIPRDAGVRIPINKTVRNWNEMVDALKGALEKNKNKGDNDGGE